MELYLLILTIFFLRVYSSETLIKTVKGKTRIKCDQDSLFVTNETRVLNDCETLIKTVKGKTCIKCDQDSLFVTNETRVLNDCNMKNSCSIPANKEIHFVCVRRQFNSSKCLLLKNCEKLISGCYVNQRKCTKPIIKHPNKFYHFLVLSKNLRSHPAISYVKLKPDDYVEIDENCWFLLKASNESEENFGEFLAESSQITTEATTKGFIILGVIVIVLLTIFPLTTYACSRKRFQKENTNDINETSLGEIDTTGNIVADDTVTCKNFNNHLDEIVDNEFYQVNTLESHSQQKPQNKEDAETSVDVYAAINKKKEISHDIPMNPGNLYHVDVNGDTYTLVYKKEAEY